jgi:hypothetical protein
LDLSGPSRSGAYIYDGALAAICWSIWKARNKASFEKKLIKIPIEINFFVCAFMQYRGGLYSEDTQKLIQDGMDWMVRTTIKLIGKKKGPQEVLALKNKDANAENPDGDTAS